MIRFTVAGRWHRRNGVYGNKGRVLAALEERRLLKAHAREYLLDPVRWREALSTALGSNGQVIAALIPEIELIIGKQPPAPAVPPEDVANRFRRVFGRFLGVFARAEHPLVLFFDDLQWVDTASLDLLGFLSTDPAVRHLLLIGAYRDNEVDTSKREVTGD